jgi:cytochrome bd-type quinol oxidase subunit 2
MFENCRRAAMLGSALVVLSGALTLLLTSADLQERLREYSAPEFAFALLFAIGAVVCAWCRVDRHFREKFREMHELYVIEQSAMAPAAYMVASVGAFFLVGAMGLAATTDGYGVVILITIVSVLHGFRNRPPQLPTARLVS